MNYNREKTIGTILQVLAIFVIPTFLCQLVGIVCTLGTTYLFNKSPEGLMLHALVILTIIVALNVLFLRWFVKTSLYRGIRSLPYHEYFFDFKLIE